MGENVAARGAWHRWVRQPQTVWLRKALFQVHLWSGVGLALYVFFISVTGSVLVYRNELYAWAAPPDEEARVGMSFWLVGKLIELHDDLLSGPTGRTVNGFGAIAVLFICLTGAVLWWPGIARWRDHVVLRRGVGWKRFTWQLHSVIGFWSVAFLLVLAASGIYLCFADFFSMAADWLEPPTDRNGGTRFVDGALYWLAYLHFGRINGIGIPCGGPGLCDQATKATWAIVGALPAAMAVTGVIMWWNRVARRWQRRSDSARFLYSPSIGRK